MLLENLKTLGMVNKDADSKQVIIQLLYSIISLLSVLPVMLICPYPTGGLGLLGNSPQAWSLFCKVLIPAVIPYLYLLINLSIHKQRAKKLGHLQLKPIDVTFTFLPLVLAGLGFQIYFLVNFFAQ